MTSWHLSAPTSVPVGSELRSDDHAPVLALISEPADRRMLAGRAPRSARLRFCASCRQICDELFAYGVAAVVVGIDDAPPEALHVVAESAAVRHIPVLVRIRPTPQSVRTLLRLHAVNPDLTVSIVGHDAIEQCLTTILASDKPSDARAAIIAGVADSVSPVAMAVVVGAASIGDRAVSVNDLAILHGVSPRILEIRLSAEGLLPPKELLMWMLALHTAWRVTRQRWTPKRAAAAARLPSARALALRFERTVGIGPAALEATLGFQEVLQQFISNLVYSRNAATGRMPACSAREQ